LRCAQAFGEDIFCQKMLLNASPSATIAANKGNTSQHIQAAVVEQIEL